MWFSRFSSLLDYQTLINRTQRSVTQTFHIKRSFHQQIMALIVPQAQPWDSSRWWRRVSPGAALGGWAAQRQPRQHTGPAPAPSWGQKALSATSVFQQLPAALPVRAPPSLWAAARGSAEQLRSSTRTPGHRRARNILTPLHGHTDLPQQVPLPSCKMTEIFCRW